MGPTSGQGSPANVVGAEVAVVGGGIIGLACARALAARGVEVVVLERGRVGREASWAAAGMLAPLAEVPEAGPLFNACRGSRDAWADFAAALSDETGCDLDYDRTGALLLGSDDQNPSALDDVLQAAKALDEPAERLGRADLHALVPALSPHVDEAVLLPGEHRVSNRRVCRALAQAVTKRGVAVHEDWPVERIERVGRVARTSDSFVLHGPRGSVSAERVLVTAGAWSNGIDGVPPLPIRPVRGQMLRLDGVDWPWLGSIRGALYAVRRAGGGLLMGATVEEAGFDDRTTLAGQRQLLDACLRMFPGLSENSVRETWSGLRPGSADDHPIIGPVADDLWVATGHFRNGILLAPWTAATVVAGLVDGVAAPAAFDGRRFRALAHEHP